MIPRIQGSLFLSQMRKIGYSCKFQFSNSTETYYINHGAHNQFQQTLLYNRHYCKIKTIFNENKLHWNKTLPCSFKTLSIEVPSLTHFNHRIHRMKSDKIGVHLNSFRRREFLCGKISISNLCTNSRLYCTRSTTQKKTTKVVGSDTGKSPNVIPVSTKRIIRKKKMKDFKIKDQEIFDVTAYSTSEEIDLEALSEALKVDGLYTILPLPEDCEDALHVEAYYRVNNESREILFFRDGAIVFWNVPRVERNAVLRKTREHQEFVYDPELIEEEQENVHYIFTDSGTHLVGDEIYLQNPETSGDPESHQLEKYTFSNVLANSVKLAIWEATLEKYVDTIEYILQDLKDGKKLKISRQEVLRKTGELLTLRHLINLSSDLLDIPDFYWNRTELEALYMRSQNQLNIGKRVKVMNDKLNHCCELAQLLREQLNDKHHTQLEWLIILLIAIEVLFEVLHMAGIK